MPLDVCEANSTVLALALPPEKAFLLYASLRLSLQNIQFKNKTRPSDNRRSCWYIINLSIVKISREDFVLPLGSEACELCGEAADSYDKIGVILRIFLCVEKLLLCCAVELKRHY